jgi:hypothetical protein
MEDGAHQRGEVLDAGRLRHVVQRFGTWAAKLDLAQGARHQQRQRSFLMAHQLLQRTVEAKAGLHAYGHYLESVGQHCLQLCAPLADELAQPQQREVEAQHGAGGDADQYCQRRADHDPDGRAQRSEAGAGRDAQGLNARRVEAEWVADEVQLALEARRLRRRREPADLSGDRFADGLEEALTEWLLELQGDGALAQASS